MTEPDAKKSWMGKIFEPPTDFYALLVNQAQKTLAGMLALEEWIVHGAPERCQRVRDLEREADDLKLDLERKLFDTLVTPFDREDIYDLSARMDEIINGAKATVREIEALDVDLSDPWLREMAATLVEGTRCLVLAFSNLNSNLQEAAEQATLARKSENRVAKMYRTAMRELFEQNDVKKILKVGEVYRCMVKGSEKLDVVGEKLLHVIVKIG